jgi:hypothetical protein
MLCRRERKPRRIADGIKESIVGKLPKEKNSGISEDAGCHDWNPQVLKALVDQ